MDFQNLMTLLTFIGLGVSGIFLWYTNRDKEKLKAELARNQERHQVEVEKIKADIELAKKEKELEFEQTKAQFLADIAIAQQNAQANLEAQKDQREDNQEQDRLSREYHRAEGHVAHQITSELLREAQEFIQGRMTKASDSHQQTLSDLYKIVDGQARNIADLVKLIYKLEHEQRQIRANHQTQLDIIREVYEYYQGILNDKKRRSEE